MYHHTAWFGRLLLTIMTCAMVCASVLAAPVPHAYAREQKTALFRAEFDSAPLGPLTGPLAVETGTVVPQGGAVSIAPTPSGQALALDGSSGQATALLQWSNHPGALPLPFAPGQVKKHHLDLSADFTSTISTTAGTSFGVISDTTFFEFFSFGANGALTRAGTPIGLTSTPSSTIHLDARISFAVVAGNAPHTVVVREVRITLTTTSGRVTLTAGFPSTLTLAMLKELRFQAPAGSGVATVDHVLVQLSSGGDDDDGPAPVIIIRDGDIEQEVENVGGVIFVSIKITIVNTGGAGHGCFLVFSLDDLDELFDLADVSFLDGVGFVQRIEGGLVYIGLGQNNVIDVDGKVRVKIKFKSKQNRLDIKINAKFTLNIGDTTIVVPPVVIVVPPAVPPGTTPIGSTPPLTPTTGLTPTTDLTQTIIIQRLALERIDVRFQATWRNRGGLAVFGLPLTEPMTLPNGIVVQYFERARLEWHPELRGTPFEVLLGLLAVELGYAQPAAPAPTAPAEVRWYYGTTGHLIAQPFRTYWQSRSGLAIFGLPITEVMIENGRQVQYFERVRLELHPELAGTPYEVQIGHLGVLSLERGK